MADNRQIVFDALYNNGPMNAAGLMQATKLGREDALGIVRDARNEGWIVTENGIIGLSPEHANPALAQTEPQVVVDEFSQVPPTPATPKPATPAPTPKAQTPKPATPKAQTQAQSEGDEGGDGADGFPKFPSLDKLTLEELDVRMTAAQNFADSFYAAYQEGRGDEYYYGAEILKRWMRRTGRRFNHMKKEAGIA